MSREPRSSPSVRTGQRPAVRRTGARPPGPRDATRHQARRHDREQHYQRLTVIGAGIIVLLVAILLGIGWYQSYVRPYHQRVITVGSMTADLDYFIRRLKAIIPQFASSDPQVVLNAAPDAARDQIEQDFVILQRASASGVAATDSEVEAEILRQLGILTVNGVQPDRAVMESGIRNKLGSSGLSLDQYRQQVKAQLLRTKMQEKLGQDYPKTGPQARYEELILNKQDDAKSLLSRLNNGESWETVAADLRKATSAGTVAQFDFQPKLQIDEKLADALFALNDDGHTDVVPTGDGKFVVAHLIQRDDQHPLSDDQVKGLSATLFSRWVDDQRKALTIKENLSDDQKLFAMAHSGWEPKQRQAPPAQAQPGAPNPGINTAPGIATGPGGPAPPAPGAPSGSNPP